MLIVRDSPLTKIVGILVTETSLGANLLLYVTDNDGPIAIEAWTEICLESPLFGIRVYLSPPPPNFRRCSIKFWEIR